MSAEYAVVGSSDEDVDYDLDLHVELELHDLTSDSVSSLHNGPVTVTAGRAAPSRKSAWCAPFGFHDYRLLFLTNVFEFFGTSLSEIGMALFMFIVYVETL